MLICTNIRLKYWKDLVNKPFEISEDGAFGQQQEKLEKWMRELAGNQLEEPSDVWSGENNSDGLESDQIEIRSPSSRQIFGGTRRCLLFLENRDSCEAFRRKSRDQRDAIPAWLTQIGGRARCTTPRARSKLETSINQFVNWISCKHCLLA